ncbi:PGRP2 amidase, partial [Urocolius indicus]|nr:PGRP2 amidase [Urocolius indicus]
LHLPRQAAPSHLSPPLSPLSPGLPPRHMDSVVELVEALTSDTDFPGSVPALARALGTCSSPGCRVVLGDPNPIPPAPQVLSHDQWLFLTQLLSRQASDPGADAVLVPDGSTVSLGPLLAGIEVGLKKAAGSPTPTSGSPTPTLGSPPFTLAWPIDPLYAVTIAEVLATSFLLARGDNRPTLGPTGCWDDVGDPQNYTLLGPPSPIPDAVANGAMDGVLLGAQVAKGPIPLAKLLRDYYGTGNGTAEGRPPSSYRRRGFGALTAAGKLEGEVLAMLRVMRELEGTRELLEDVGPEEMAAVARRAARDFSETYVGCPPIVPRCLWGAAPYRGTP